MRLANAPSERLRVRNATPGPRGGGLYLSESQRTRLLGAAFAVVAEQGYRGMTVRAVAERAGVSSKTFYDLFEGREGCFLAAFEDGVEQLTEAARPAYAAQRDWAAGIRAGLAALLALLDAEPALCRLVLVEALGVGPRVLARRAEVLDRVARVVDGGREGMEGAGELPAMTGAGVAGAVSSMVHTRLVEQDAKSGRDVAPLVGLLNDLMATIVLPYRGREAAAHELTRPAPHELQPAVPPGGREPSRSRDERAAHPAWRAVHASDRLSPDGGGRRDAPPIGPLGDFKLTVSRHAVLSAVAELCGEGLEPCNREVGERTGVADDAHISRFMTDLETYGLVENTRAGAVGTRKAWRMTALGQAVLDANRGGRVSIKEERGEDLPVRKSASVNGRATAPPGAAAAELERPTPETGLRAVPRTGAPSGRPGTSTSPADFRLTVRTQMALVVVAKAGTRGAYPSNLEVAQRIGISAKAAVSRMMSRLQDQGLVENTRGRDTKGVEKAWRLTARGHAVLDAHRPARSTSTKNPAAVRGGKLVPKRGRQTTGPSGRRDAPPIASVRMTYRTALALEAIANAPGISNLGVARHAQVNDQGQVSKLLSRLERHGLVQNTGRGQTQGAPNEWRLTPQGEALLHANTPARETQAA